MREEIDTAEEAAKAEQMIEVVLEAVGKISLTRAVIVAAFFFGWALDRTNDEPKLAANARKMLIALANNLLQHSGVVVSQLEEQ